MASATTQLAVTSTTFTDLGVSPTQIQVVGIGPVTVVVADSTPSVGTGGFTLHGNQGSPAPPFVIYAADASSHTYVAMYGGVPSAIVYNPVYDAAV